MSALQSIVVLKNRTVGTPYCKGNVASGTVVISKCSGNQSIRTAGVPEWTVRAMKYTVQCAVRLRVSTEAVLKCTVQCSSGKMGYTIGVF